ncbi:FAD-binding and (Fe-S)-binding domain-containing protein [Angustibacter sp. Root456]|uniref:FAD-binding and (Fe-S)-binding domain-containing protein n=1 Tax=Angustibacter sp. Root456 TaxID=1736539 RepID=UPI0006FD089A|nr:FAD-binding and (Fe-S)-binding domain-containing protein [Angustibacter sp. Root456]KQX62030.1 oxidoreductase [Angustibacter sp. Root456]
MSELVEELRRAGVAEVDDSELRRTLYSSDASLYRVPPRAVVVPQHVDEVLATMEVCRSLGVPVTMRGAGTSIAGNAVGAGVVVDVSRHLNRVLDVDTEAGTALVEPGVVHAALQQQVQPSGWRFGPDPSTHNRATFGGMIGNNACGSRALAYGRTSDNVLGLDVVTARGERLTVGRLDGRTQATTASPTLDALRRVIDADLAVVRTEFGRFRRQVSGYSLEHLLPENGFDVARFLVGTEGTLALTLAARVRLVRDPTHRVLVVLGYPSMADAADAVPALLEHEPVACEGLDRRIVDVVRDRRGPSAVPDLPDGDGWLFVELAGDDPRALQDAARRVVGEAGALDARVVDHAGQAAALWRIREDGAGLSARTPAGEPAHSGWEDAAVPPDRLGDYLREFDDLMAGYGLDGLPYGHFGDGCVHIRIDFPFRSGTRVFRDFMLDAGRLAAAHGGSMSGEHGDGRARSELLPLMYSREAIALFGRVKTVLDPDNLLNPGVVVDPLPLDADVRVAHAPPYRQSLGLAYRHDRGDLSMAVHRCTGVGKCRADTTGTGGVMCPSYLATKDEKDTTRGRSRVLQDAVAGHLGPDPWRSEAVHDALDLCLSCKGCSSDCPTGVDMASYKAEYLHQRWRGRLRPRSHYALGWLPRWTRLVARVPGLTRLANLMMRVRLVHPLVTWAAGVDARRSLPTFAPHTFRQWFASREAPSRPARHGDVVLFVDTFTDAFSPDVGQAAVAVLEDAGYRVRVTSEPVCCGLTWVSTGQLDGARKQASATVQALLPHVRGGAAVLGLEPSCTGVLRSDVLELLPDDELAAAREVADATVTLAELLRRTPDWSPPDLGGERAVAQPHCHHHAVMGWQADAALLDEAGADVQRLGGCCGLAGNWGVERGHHETSVAVAETQLLPAVRELGDGGVVLADGFSCRTQLDDLASRQGVHLAQLLARHLSR